MSLNSVNTNMGAMVALQSLNATQQDLAATQKRISTGYRVADATDDGAAYAVTQGIRATVGALTSANQQLGGVQGLLATTNSSLNNVSNTMGSMRNLLVKLADSGVQGTDRANYAQQFADKLANIKNFIKDAGYNGKTLIGNITPSIGTFGRAAVVRNENGASYGIATFGGSAFYACLATFTSTLLKSNTAAVSIAAMITASSVFIRNQTKISTELNTIGSAINYVNAQ